MNKKQSLEKHFLGIGKDSLIYGLGNAVLKILALLTAPIFTRVFAPSEYGVMSLIASVISFLSLFLIFGMDNAIFVSFWQYKKERKEIISSAFWFLFVWGIFLSLLAIIFSPYIAHLIFKNGIYQKLLLITFSTAFLTLLINFCKTILRLEFKAKVFAFISAFNAILATSLMIFFVVYLHKGLLGYFTGSLIGTFITFVLAIFLVRKNIAFKISSKRLLEMVKFGAFIVPASLSFFVFDLSDRFFLNHYRTLSEIGLYSIGINIVSILVFFSYALSQAWSPQVLKIYYSSRKVFSEFVPRFFSYYLIFFFIIASVISIFGLEILKILTTDKFFGAAKVIGPLALAMVFSASNQVTSLGITISRKTKYFAIDTALAAIINILLNFVLIPKYGMIGAGWATAISYLVLTAAYYFHSRKLISLKIDWQKILKLVLLSLIVITVLPLTWKFSFGANLLLKIGEFLIYILLLYLLGIIEKQEISYLKSYFLKLTRKNDNRPNLSQIQEKV